MAYDFYSPFMRAAIVIPFKDNTRIPLWTNTGPAFIDDASTAVDRTGLTSLPFLESISIFLDLGFLPKISAVLTPPFSESRRLLSSDIMEWGRNILEVQLGYTSGTNTGPELSPVFEGLLQQPEIALGINCSVTLNAQGVAGYDMTLSQSMETYSNIPRKEAIIKLAASQSRNLKVDFSKIEPRSEADSLLKADITKTQGAQTDWLFMWELVRNAGCYFEIKGDTLVVKARDLTLGADPRFNLRLYDFKNGKLGPSDDENVPGEFPILSVNSPTMAVYLPGATKALVSAGIISKTGKPHVEVVDPLDVGTPVGPGGLGAGVTKPIGTTNADLVANAATATIAAIVGTDELSNKTVVVDAYTNTDGTDKTTGKGGVPYPSDVSFPSSSAEARQAYETSFRMGIQLEVETLGIPSIIPTDKVRIFGVGERFDFDYSVFAVVHTMSSAGFTTKLILQSNTEAQLNSVLKTQQAAQSADSASDKEVVLGTPTGFT